MFNHNDVDNLSNTNSDIQYQLTRLYDLTYNIQDKEKVVVELGMRYGTSTKVLLAAVNESGGHVYSIDTCQLVNFPDEKNFTFIMGNDLEIVKKWEKPINHLFIDTVHTYKQTLAELTEWGILVISGGIITLHDTNQMGVMEAIKEYLKTNKDSRFNNFLESNGLGVIKKR
jgi:cephalosporin hydroxylase